MSSHLSVNSFSETFFSCEECSGYSKVVYSAFVTTTTLSNASEVEYSAGPLHNEASIDLSSTKDPSSAIYGSHRATQNNSNSKSDSDRTQRMSEKKSLIECHPSDTPFSPLSDVYDTINGGQAAVAAAAIKVTSRRHSDLLPGGPRRRGLITRLLTHCPNSSSKQQTSKDHQGMFCSWDLN